MKIKNFQGGGRKKISFDERWMAPTEDDIKDEPKQDENQGEDAEDVAEVSRHNHSFRQTIARRKGGSWDFMNANPSHPLWYFLGIFGRSRKVTEENEDEVLAEFAVFMDLAAGLTFSIPTKKDVIDASLKLFVRTLPGKTGTYKELCDTFENETGHKVEYWTMSRMFNKEMVRVVSEQERDKEKEIMAKVAVGHGLLTKYRKLSGE